tara:strand:+ start:124 stop:576 length:453 start_codon:yes stop_codon:yes gene_type:complete
MKKYILNKTSFLLIAICALLLGSCALNPKDGNYVAQPFNKKITEVCLIKNPKVQERGFDLFMVKKLEQEGITVSEDKNNNCPYYITYVAHYYGIEQHITSADIVLHKTGDSSVQGKSTFNISFFNPAKYHAHAATVIPVMINELLPEQKK